ncbi:AbgT family transporter [Tatumella ptyseos]|uniref:AbgT family transporter n=1 Tax=Tatumella ptyseos TaxID=82987 RepID=UPI0026F122CD|nr:AbgT family transporter [Tatumella ptyseos]WKX25671.1 AbgT family transporter [Tatumella ptyseos]
MSVITPIRQPNKLFYWIEKAGNKLPHPFLLFLYLIVILMVASAVISHFNWSVISPVNGEKITVNNIFSPAGIQWFLPNIIKNFSGFAPLGSILALVLGAGLAEKVGLLQALMIKMSSLIHRRYASYMVLFIAFFSHLSSDAALVVMPPLGALIFLAVGRHPVAGLLAAIAGVASGFTANLLIVSTDVLLSGISTEAAKSVNPALQVTVIDNWFFMAASVVVLTVVGALLTDKWIEPRLPAWKANTEQTLPKLTSIENQGLKAVAVTALIVLGVVVALAAPAQGILRNPQTGSLVPSPLMQGIVPIIIIFFLLTSVVYGKRTGQIRQASDIPVLLTDSMKNMAGFIVMVFPLAQFVALFTWSNMGKFMAMGLTNLMENADIHGAPAFIGLLLLSALLCMFIASGSAIWSILAPVFVPMFVVLGFHPAFAQIIFRIGDSCVLPLSPLSPFLPLFLGFLQKYIKEAELGTYYRLIMPYPLVFFISWIVLLSLWYVCGLPIGPGVYPHLS